MSLNKALLATLITSSIFSAYVQAEQVRFSEKDGLKVKQRMNAEGHCKFPMFDNQKDNLRNLNAAQSCSEECVGWLKDELSTSRKNVEVTMKNAFQPSQGIAFFSEIQDSLNEEVQSSVNELMAAKKYDAAELPELFGKNSKELEIALYNVVGKDGKKESLNKALTKFPGLKQRIIEFCDRQAKTGAGKNNCTSAFPTSLLKSVQEFNKRFDKALEDLRFASISTQLCTGQKALYDPFAKYLNQMEKDKFYPAKTSMVKNQSLDTVDFDNPNPAVALGEKAAPAPQRQEKNHHPKKTLNECLDAFNTKNKNKSGRKLDISSICDSEKNKDLIPFLDVVDKITGKLSSDNYHHMVRMKALSRAFEKYRFYAGQFPEVPQSCSDFKQGLEKMRASGERDGVKDLADNPFYLIQALEGAKQLVAKRASLIEKAKKAEESEILNQQVKRTSVYQAKSVYLHSDEGKKEFLEYMKILEQYPVFGFDRDIDNIDLLAQNPFPIAEEFIGEVGDLSKSDDLDASVEKMKKAFKKVVGKHMNSFKAKQESAIHKLCRQKDAGGISNEELSIFSNLGDSVVELEPGYKEYHECVKYTVNRHENAHTINEVGHGINTFLGAMIGGLGEVVISVGSGINSHMNVVRAATKQDIMKACYELGECDSKAALEVAEAVSDAKTNFYMDVGGTTFGLVEGLGSTVQFYRGQKLLRNLLKTTPGILKVVEGDTAAVRSAVNRIARIKASREIASPGEVRKAFDNLLEAKRVARMHSIEAMDKEIQNYLKQKKAVPKALSDALDEQINAQADDIVLALRNKDPKEFKKTKEAISDSLKHFKKNFGEEVSPELEDKLVALANKMKTEEGLSEGDINARLKKMCDDAAAACAVR